MGLARAVSLHAKVDNGARVWRVGIEGARQGAELEWRVSRVPGDM